MFSCSSDLAFAFGSQSFFLQIVLKIRLRIIHGRALHTGKNGILIFNMSARVALSFLMSVSDGLDPYIFLRKMEKTQPMRQELDGKVFISRRSWQFSFVVIMNKVCVPNCTSTRRVNINFCHQREGINRGNEITSNILLFCIVEAFFPFCIPFKFR